MNGVKISLNDCKSVNIKKKQTARSLVDMIKNKAIMFHLAIQCFILLVFDVFDWFIWKTKNLNIQITLFSFGLDSSTG